MQIPFVHERFATVERDIFIKTLVPDCMTHACRMFDTKRDFLDACCQYGADVDIAERERILGHQDAIKLRLHEEVKALPWFTDHLQHDADFPSGQHVRTKTHKTGCLFLSHDNRGCAIHRTGLEEGWDWRPVKPHICQLFPLSYTTAAIVFSDDYVDYSCAHTPGAPTVYRVMREVLGRVLGESLVTALDAVEREVIAPRPVSLPVMR